LRYLRSAIKRRQAERAGKRTRVGLGLALAALLFLHTNARTTPPAGTLPEPLHSAAETAARSGSLAVGSLTSAIPAKVWAVESHDRSVAYSNGLQIRDDFLAHSTQRRYSIYARGTLIRSSERTQPAGIVYHTTESLLLPLAEDEKAGLLRTRENVLSYISRKHLYNFVIDRFGQVFRIVPESEVAYHAGNSIWADASGVYDGLNDSFIGVSFEAKTAVSIQPTPAQVRSGRMLTELLRGEYSIAEANCVTHAQVSVNPTTMGIGYHTDWATNFPFRDMGLAGGYDLPIAAIGVFGFEYSHSFLDAIGGRPWQGITAAEEALKRNALALGVPPHAYRAHLQAQYHHFRSQLHDQSTDTPRT
jgi:N-acetylmuramoyl-L-alanine amidase